MRPGRSALVILLVLMIGLTAAPAALTQTKSSSAETETGEGASIVKAIDYLKGRQQSDGGFAEPGKDSSEMLTMWAVCGISAVGEDVNTWRKSGKSPLDYLASRATKLTKLTDLEKECLAVCCAGKEPRAFGGRDLVADIKARMAADGHIGDLVNEHCWGIIALRAAGEQLPDSSRAWLVARQNIDGGYGYGIDTGSDPDDTGAALQALIAAGENPHGNTVKRAVSYLRFCQASDAGFTYNAGESNVGSTAWAVQGIVATGQDPSSDDWKRSGKTPLEYLASTQQPDGHFRYMKSSDANAAWMTAEALPAITKKAYPLKPDSVPVTNDPTPSNTSNSTISGEAVVGDATDGSATGEGDQFNGETGADENARGYTGAGGSVNQSLAANENTTGGSRQWRPNGLAVFLVICVLYIVVLGLVYILLEYYFIPRRHESSAESGFLTNQR